MCWRYHSRELDWSLKLRATGCNRLSAWERGRDGKVKAETVLLPFKNHRIHRLVDYRPIQPPGPPSGPTAAAVHTKHAFLKRNESSVLFYMELDGCFVNASPGGHTRDALCFLTQPV